MSTEGGSASLGRGLALTIGVVGSLPPLLLAILSSQPRMGCGEQWRKPDWESAMVAVGGALCCFLLGYGANRWLARRLWAKGFFSKVLCLLPPLVTSLLSIAFGLLGAFLLSSALC
jgi:hypothetical protein